MSGGMSVSAASDGGYQGQRHRRRCPRFCQNAGPLTAWSLVPRQPLPLQRGQQRLSWRTSSCGGCALETSESHTRRPHGPGVGLSGRRRPGPRAGVGGAQGVAGNVHGFTQGQRLRRCLARRVPSHWLAACRRRTAAAVAGRLPPAAQQQVGWITAFLRLLRQGCTASSERPAPHSPRASHPRAAALLQQPVAGLLRRVTSQAAQVASAVPCPSCHAAQPSRSIWQRTPQSAWARARACWATTRRVLLGSSANGCQVEVAPLGRAALAAGGTGKSAGRCRRAARTPAARRRACAQQEPTMSCWASACSTRSQRLPVCANTAPCRSSAAKAVTPVVFKAGDGGSSGPRSSRLGQGAE